MVQGEICQADTSSLYSFNNEKGKSQLAVGCLNLTLMNIRRRKVLWKLNAQIKKYRMKLNLSQEELAEKIYVTRQTISNWENEKSYPDIHSLLLLGSLFNVSLDKLIKGDIEIMKEIVNEQEIKELKRYSTVFTVHLMLLILLAVPLFIWLEYYAFIIFGIFFVITMFWAFKVEKIKKKYNVQTYKEIIAFMEGKRLDEIQRMVEAGKYPYQKFLNFIISAVVAFAVSFVLGFIIKSII